VHVLVEAAGTMIDGLASLLLEPGQARAADRSPPIDRLGPLVLVLAAKR
jgi:hypothetical protein